MIRILTVAAVAAMIAAPAAAQSVRIPTDGKSPEQLNADIQKAATRVCRLAVIGASFPHEMYESCFKHTIADATAKAQALQLANATTNANSTVNAADNGAN